MLFSRRVLLAIPGLLLLPRAAWAGAEDRLRDLEQSSGARIGVAAIDTGTDNQIRFRDNERFTMCSSFKLSLAAAVLARAEKGEEMLDRVIIYKKSDLLDVSPATARNAAAGMTVEALCEAAVIYSDNTAANLLLAAVGGPSGVTRFWRSMGDDVSRLDRVEPALNIPDGDKDTTTPSAMLRTLRAMIQGNALAAPSRERLRRWMRANTTGYAMLRAGLPKTWSVGDKTGRYVQGDYNAAIDLAVGEPPSRAPVFIAAFTMNGRGDDAAHQKVIADIGAILGATFMNG